MFNLYIEDFYKTPLIMDPDTCKDKQEETPLNIPLKFWFTKDPRPAIPGYVFLPK